MHNALLHGRKKKGGWSPPKNKRWSVWMKRSGAQHKSLYSFLKLVSYVLTTRSGKVTMGRSILHKQAEMLVC